MRLGAWWAKSHTIRILRISPCSRIFCKEFRANIMILKIEGGMGVPALLPSLPTFQGPSSGQRVAARPLSDLGVATNFLLALYKTPEYVLSINARDGLVEFAFSRSNRPRSSTCTWRDHGGRMESSTRACPT